MIDTNYDETSFFVRHCCFTGGNDPYKQCPFDTPSACKMAVKVINDFAV